jgi:hypothetical protein
MNCTVLFRLYHNVLGGDSGKKKILPWNAVFLTYYDPAILISIQMDESDNCVPLNVYLLCKKWKALCHSEH